MSFSKIIIQHSFISQIKGVIKTPVKSFRDTVLVLTNSLINLKIVYIS
jgi:hypothetical protein